MKQIQKRMNLEKSVRVTRDEATELKKSEIEKLQDEIHKLEEQQNGNKDELQQLKQKLQQTEDDRYNLAKKKR